MNARSSANSREPEPTPEPDPAEVPLIVDAHEDIAWNWLDLGRDPRESALASREREEGTAIPRQMGSRTTGLPQWLAGRIGIIVATVFTMPQHRASSSLDRQTYASPEEAYRKGWHQLDEYHRLTDDEPRLALVTTVAELENVVKGWTGRHEDPVVGLVIGMEGADPVREPAELPEWVEHGLRIIGPAWGRTRFAGGTREPGPLTPLGRRLLDAMAELNLILDLTHLDEQAYLQAVDRYPGPVIASHSNPRRFRPGPRGLSDEMILLLAERGGVAGIVPFNLFLKPGWALGDPKDAVSIVAVADAIDHVAQLTGSSEFVALGSDFDGGFGAESIPAELDTIAGLHLVAGVLGERGYDQADIENVLYGNWLRVLRVGLP
jgi:membrane dipeptidase